VNPNLDAGDLSAQPVETQQQRGYYHTLREILQQPDTWLDTCERMLAAAPAIGRLADGVASIVLTGSGSSLYAGECVAPVLRRELGIAVEAIAAGTLLTDGTAAMPLERPGLLVSLARSGNSPESVAAASAVLAADPQMRHLVITCNASGQLATEYARDAIVLDDRTNDRSLAMTSSLTNMSLAALYLGMRRTPERYRDLCATLSRACQALVMNVPAAGSFGRAVFLASPVGIGAARESALKMLEMTDGRVPTLAETYLGVRHGPMSFIHSDTLIVCYLSTDPLLRAYEADLIAELDRKHLGQAKILFGESIPAGLLRAGDAAIDCPDCALLHVVAGQLLALYRCLAEGLHPDSPCASGAINRVVESFPIHS